MRRPESPVIICPIQFRCLVLIIVNRDLSSSISFNTSFDMCSVQLIFSILRHTFISKASNLVMSSFLIVLISAQYKATLQISVSPFFSWGTLYIFILLNPPLGNSFLLEKASFPLLFRGVNPGGWGSRPQILVRGSQGGSQWGRWSRGRVVQYYYILSCTGSISKVVTFEEK